MIFENAIFYKNAEVGFDELGNPIYQSILIGEYPSRISQWTAEELALEKRIVSQGERKLITTAKISVLKEVDSIVINGDEYAQITLKSDFKRWRLCHMKAYKNGY